MISHLTISSDELTLLALTVANDGSNVLYHILLLNITDGSILKSKKFDNLAYTSPA